MGIHGERCYREPSLVPQLGRRPDDEEVRVNDDIGVNRYLAWLAVTAMVAVVVLSVVPGSLRPDLGLHPDLEHALAYGGVAFLAVLGQKRLDWRAIAALLLVAAAMLELAQLLTPGRNASIADWLSGAAGTIFGALAAVAAARIAGRRMRSPEPSARPNDPERQ